MIGAVVSDMSTFSGRCLRSREDGGLGESQRFHAEGRAAAPPDDPGNPTADFHGERRGNATHREMTNPDARLCRKAKGQEAKLAYQGDVLMENRRTGWPSRAA